MNAKEFKNSVKELRLKLEEAGASFNVLFQTPGADALGIRDVSNKDFLLSYLDILRSVSWDLLELENNPAAAAMKKRQLSDDCDSIDFINSFTDKHCESFERILESCIFDVFVSYGFFCEELDVAELSANKKLIHLIKHAARFYKLAACVIMDFLKLLDMAVPDGGLDRIAPEARGFIVGDSPFKLAGGKLSKKTAQVLLNKAAELDSFCMGRTFRYADGKFHPANLSSIRSVAQFYGYNNAKMQFKKHFSDFSLGKSNLPLLISSLPGLGKTHFSIAHTLAFENLTLILPEPEDLEKPLECLIRKLATRKNRRFVLFFDDVNPKKVNWYYFRTNVGGSFALPDNISIVIASNYKFPANISSRGRGFVFPMFDEINCQKMIYDYLVSLGMRKPPSELVSVMAADYIEEFGQKMFEELSPRTLVRYLDRYNNDTTKRKRMLDLSHEEVVSRPDSQMFFEVNVKLLRDLYGEEAIEELKKEQLGE